MTTIFRLARAAGLAAGLLGLAAVGTAAAGDATGTNEDLGKQIFTQGTDGVPACAVCHVLADANAAGTIGPDLDQLKPDAERIRKAVRDGLGIMPAFGDA